MEIWKIASIEPFSWSKRRIGEFPDCCKETSLIDLIQLLMTEENTSEKRWIVFSEEEERRIIKLTNPFFSRWTPTDGILGLLISPLTKSFARGICATRVAVDGKLGSKSPANYPLAIMFN